MALDDIFGYSKIISRDSKLWREVAAEYFGTMFIVLLGCGSAIFGWKDGEISSTIRIAFAFGFGVVAALEALGHVSGHINPAVTLAMLFVRRIEVLPALLFIAFQLMGATSGVALLEAVTPKVLNTTFGLTVINKGLTVEQGLGIELLITFFLVIVIFAVNDEERDDIRGVASAAIGTTVIAVHLFTIPYTGCGLNPARVFGSSAIMSNWTNHWVYWLGECSGALLGALVYVLFLTADDYTVVERLARIWYKPRTGYLPMERSSPRPTVQALNIVKAAVTPEMLESP